MYANKAQQCCNEAKKKLKGKILINIKIKFIGSFFGNLTSNK